MESLATELEETRGVRVLLPEEAQCPECFRFDINYPGVSANLSPAQLRTATCGCKDQREATRAFRLQEANLPSNRNGRHTFKNFVTTVEGVAPMHDAAQRLVSGEGPPTLVLVGDVGCGKTHIAEATAWNFLAEGKTVRYEKASRMLVALRDTQSFENVKSLEAWVQWYHTRNLLILDDLGVQDRPETSWARDVLLTIMDFRLEHAKAMVITTNCDKAQMEQVLGKRIASRLFSNNPELDTVAMVPVTAGDYRA